MFGYPAAMSRLDDVHQQYQDKVYEAGSDRPIHVISEELAVQSAQVSRLAEKAEQEQACKEIATYVREHLRDFKNASASELKVECTHDENYWAYRLRVDFTFNGYVYTSDRMIKGEAVNAHLDSVESWKTFLNREVQSIHDLLWNELRKNGITRLPAATDRPNGWFEATGRRGPRNAPLDAEVGEIFKDLFGNVWVYDGANWRAVRGHQGQMLLEDVDREREEALLKEGEAKAAEAIKRSMAALGAVPDPEFVEP